MIIAEGVPIADEKDIGKDMYLLREVAFILHDRVKNVYLGNIVYIPVTWKDDYEDRYKLTLLL